MGLLRCADSMSEILSMIETQHSSQSRWRSLGLRLVSGWLCVHVFCVFIAPGAMPPASPLLQRAQRIALPYNQLFFLNHGYHYFAPDPGASTLIRWSVPREGEAALVGRFPNPEIQPRLLYHRYFMLAENLWAFDESFASRIERGYARHVATLHHADRVELQRISHEPSSIVRIQAGGLLDDPETFSIEPIGAYDFSQDASAANPAGSGDF